MTYQYTNSEYLDMVRAYARANDSLPGAINLYREMFPNRRIPTASVILNANQRLRDFGQFTVPVHAQGRGGVAYPVSLHEDILEYFENHPQASTRNAARRFGVSQWTVWNQLHRDGSHPYHFRPVQELGVNDYEPRINFCRWFLQNTDKNILFTDEATFTKLGIFNVHNEHWWSHSNPYVTRQDAFQHRFSVNVWAGVLNNCLLGPYFIEERLNGASYINILNKVMDEMLDDVPLSYLRNLFYQHDGAPAHYQTQVRTFLNTHFGDCWIGRGGPVPWPARSPDLTPLDFYLWGEVKRLVYATEYANREELKMKISSAFETVKSDPFVLNRVKDNMRKRAELCITRGGAHFEQLLRTQDLPVFIRMVDKDTLWDFDNGLATLVTTLLQMNLQGYTLVLPDMIGGNGYNEKPSKELFVRWLQANVFMPTLQYSFVPWDHDDEAVEICRKYTELHAQYADEIVAAMQASVDRGTPVNPPIWWLDPEDETALAVWDEFLLGEKTLVAPVLEQGAVSRDIYLPRGEWVGAAGEAYSGPIWLKDYPAPLDTLPYFTLQD